MARHKIKMKFLVTGTSGDYNAAVTRELFKHM